jgi:methylated-DNA-protein-cysteine methyltransferase related protein
MTSELDRRILDVVMTLRSGEVVSYGDIADDAGFAGRSRAVGRFLATTEHEVPWWRVVNSVGRLVPGHETEQAALLRSEDVTVNNGRVVAAKHGRFGPKRSL